MRRTSMLLIATLAGAALVQPVTAVAQAPLCQGRTVTIDGTGASYVVGTEGADVMFSDTAAEVVGLGGDDVICIAAGHANPVVKAGAGDDVVDATAATGTNTFLGEGDDTYLGSRYRDIVAAGDGESDDRGRDVIDAGPRSELQDVVYSGEPRQPNDDQVRAGYVDLWWSGTSTGTAMLDGGVDSTLHLRSETSRLWVWASIGSLFIEDQPNQEFSGFTDFSISSFGDLERLVFGGSPADEHVTVNGPSPRTKLDIDLGRGDDELELTYYLSAHPRTELSGGKGTDRLALAAYGPRDLTLDLSRGRLDLGRGSRPVTARGFDDASLMARHVDVVGTSGPNTIEIGPCRGTIQGRGGPDTLSAYVDTPRGARVSCPGGRGVVLDGGAGADRLVGARGYDVLVGGPGRDRADGGAGRDTCSAEATTRCEVRR